MRDNACQSLDVWRYKAEMLPEAGQLPTILTDFNGQGLPSLLMEKARGPHRRESDQ